MVLRLIQIILELRIVVASQFGKAGSVTLYQDTHVDLWHFRLGHPSYAKMSLLNKFVSGLNSNMAIGCDICCQTKEIVFSY